jgi:hypothetical protein
VTAINHLHGTHGTQRPELPFGMVRLPNDAAHAVRGRSGTATGALTREMLEFRDDDRFYQVVPEEEDDNARLLVAYDLLYRSAANAVVLDSLTRAREELDVVRRRGLDAIARAKSFDLRTYHRWSLPGAAQPLAHGLFAVLRGAASAYRRDRPRDAVWNEFAGIRESRQSLLLALPQVAAARGMSLDAVREERDLCLNVRDGEERLLASLDRLYADFIANHALIETDRRMMARHDRQPTYLLRCAAASDRDSWGKEYGPAIVARIEWAARPSAGDRPAAPPGYGDERAFREAPDHPSGCPAKDPLDLSDLRIANRLGDNGLDLSGPRPVTVVGLVAQLARQVADTIEPQPKRRAR